MDLLQLNQYYIYIYILYYRSIYKLYLLFIRFHSHSLLPDISTIATMATNNRSDLTATDSLLIHQAQYEEHNHEYNKYNAQELLEVLGGINNVLTMLLSDNIDINDQQL